MGPVFLAYVISPLCLWAKKATGKFRVTHDLSARFRGCPSTLTSQTVDCVVSYDMVDMVIRLIQEVGQGANLA